MSHKIKEKEYAMIKKYCNDKQNYTTDEIQQITGFSRSSVSRVRSTRNYEEFEKERLIRSQTILERKENGIYKEHCKTEKSNNDLEFIKNLKQYSEQLLDIAEKLDAISNIFEIG